MKKTDKIKTGMKVLFQGKTIFTVNGRQKFSGHWYLGNEHENTMLEPEYDGNGNRQIVPISDKKLKL